MNDHEHPSDESEPVPDYRKDPGALARRLVEEARRREREGGPVPAVPAAEPFAGCRTPNEVLDELGPRYPGRVLLRSPSCHAREALRTLVRRELESALSLQKALPPVRLIRWAEDRLCGSEPLPADHQRAFLLLVADVLRAIREADALRVIGGHTGGTSTLAARAQTMALATIASSESGEAVEVARASRTLDELFPERGEVFLLCCYAALPANTVATLTQRTVAVIELQYAAASAWVLAQAA